MIGGILLATGLAIAAYGVWRSYVAARSAILPLVREGDPTRSLIDATRPLHSRTRFRTAARNVAIALGWIAVSMYGVFLATVGTVISR